MGPRVSIVVPAHNEVSRVGGLLDDLSGLVARGVASVVVVCNGCTDDTAKVASSREGVHVVEIAPRGKSHALNAGDVEAGDVYPRLYCDADVRIDETSVIQLTRALDGESARAVGPRVNHDLANAHWIVRLFYEALGAPVVAGWINRHLVGRGLYGTNRAGRARFGEFPLLIADDLFFDAQFDEGERVIVAAAQVTIPVPLSLRELLRREIRVAAGNRDLFVPRARSELTPYLEVRADNWRDRAANFARWFRQVRARDIAPLAVYSAVVGTSRLLLFVRSWRGSSLPWR